MQPYRVAVDFDGTLVRHKYPDIGSIVSGAFQWLLRWQQAGAKLILWTMRHDSEQAGPVLTDAVEFCRMQGIEFDGVNAGPGDRAWTGSPKAYAHCYVDDAGFGCPLITPMNGDRPYVNWSVVGPAVLDLIVQHNKERTNGV
ncbi:MAG: hypothetical protein WCX88_03205 [Patescibacteria group bacterium]|jgi:hypothetical protein